MRFECVDGFDEVVEVEGDVGVVISESALEGELEVDDILADATRDKATCYITIFQRTVDN